MTYSMHVTRLVNQHLDNIKRSVRNVNFIIFYNCLLIISVTVDFSQQRRFSQIQKLASSSSHFEFIITASTGVQNNERLATI